MRHAMQEALATAPSFSDRFAAGLRGFGPLGLLAVAAVVAGSFLLTLGGAARGGGRGAAPPRPRARPLAPPRARGAGRAGGRAGGAGLKVAGWSVGLPRRGPPATTPTSHSLAGNPAIGRAHV